MEGPEGFALYNSKNNPNIQVFAIEVTLDNLRDLAKITGATAITGADGMKRLIFNELTRNTRLNGIAEVGDYVLADMAGRYAPFDRELFELVYDKA